MEKTITYFGQQAKVACDGKCNKAWGRNSRPKIYPEISLDKVFNTYPRNKNINLDNFLFCSDDELGTAPSDPGTYEGRDGKPIDISEAMNKWCVRECERCSISDCGKYNEPLELKDFSKRISNY